MANKTEKLLYENIPWYSESDPVNLSETVDINRANSQIVTQSQE
jgi:hypothetical protein